MHPDVNERTGSGMNERDREYHERVMAEAERDRQWLYGCARGFMIGLVVGFWLGVELGRCFGW